MYDQWKTQSDHDADPRRANAPLLESPEVHEAERDARGELEQNLESLLEAAEAGELAPQEDVNMDVDAWLETATDDELDRVRGLIDVLLVKRQDEALARAQTLIERNRRLGITAEPLVDSRGRPLKRGPIKKRKKPEPKEPQS